MGPGEAIELGCHQPAKALTIDGEGGRHGHADEDAAWGGSATDDIARRDDRSYGTAFATATEVGA
jgi:hypothetical protein